MKTSHICPKCENAEVLFLPQIADRDDKNRVRPLVAHVVHYDWRDDVEIGVLSAYICRKCGFTELYTSGASELPFDKIPGAKVLTPKTPPRKTQRPSSK